jgi:hypothetical protein
VLQYAIDPPKEFVLPYLRKDGTSLAYVPVMDKEMIMTAVNQNGMALYYVEKRFQDADMVMTAVIQNGMALEYVSDELKAMKKVVLAAVKQNGLSLMYAPAHFHSDAEVVSAAVRQNGMALKDASPDLRENEDIVFLALLQNGKAFEFTTLKRIPKLLLIASAKGYDLTKEELQLVIPYVDHYNPSPEEIQLIKSFMEPSESPFKKQKKNIKEIFNEKYKHEIKEELERLEKIPEYIRGSVDKLNECRGRVNCTISGGTKKNKRVMYGSRSKIIRTRKKSRRTRT